jgi:glyoxylase-like metal-dependent hydrolase (beta-lactamase superfamily II)
MASSTITFFPVGDKNGGMILLKLNNAQKTTILIDCSIGEETIAEYCDVNQEFRNRLPKDSNERPYVDCFILTHRHDDHIGALDKLVAEYKVVVYDKKRSEGNYSVHPFNFSIIENKGHSDDSISFYFKDEDIMFTGDFLFKGTIGRTDLKTGSSKDMVISLINIKKYNPNTIIYPGHGEESTLGYEFENNMFFKNI